jgi:hypothetical protein
MTIQNTYTDTTANAAGIPTATDVDSKDMFIGDTTDIEKGGAQPQSTGGCNSR